MAHIIEVLVTPTGQTTVQTKGYSGSECLGASQWLEQALGIATSDQKTSEYYHTETNQQDIIQDQ
jgi:hypothetical protein